MGGRIPSEGSSCQRPNGSRLSGGRDARRRKERERQTKGLASESTQFFPTCGRRPMPSIGPHCHELRIPDRDATWRIVYRIDGDAIVIVEGFSKKSRETPRAIIERSRQRLRAYDDATR